MMLSIIIPYYNSSQHIEKTLNSINYSYRLSGVTTNYQVIIVNDGSIETEKLILEKIISKISIPVIKIDKINGGVSSARNEGIRIANGKYIYFLDSDDYLEPNFFRLLKEYENYNDKKTIDTLFSPLKINNSVNFIPENEIIKNPIIADEDFLIKLLNFKCLHLSCFIFLKSTLYNSYFIEKCNSGEDLFYILKTIFNKNIYYINSPFATYNYDGKFHPASNHGFEYALSYFNKQEKLKLIILKHLHNRYFLTNCFYKSSFHINYSFINKINFIFYLFRNKYLYQFIQKRRFK